MSIKTKIASAAMSIIGEVKEHSPQIAFVAGTVALVTGGVLLYKGAKKTVAIDEQYTKERNDICEKYGVDENTYDVSELEPEEKKGFRREIVSTTAHQAIDISKKIGPGCALLATSFLLYRKGYSTLGERCLTALAYASGLEANIDGMRNRIRKYYGEDAEKKIVYGLDAEKKTILEEQPDGTVKETQQTIYSSDGEPEMYDQFAFFFSKFDEDGNFNPHWNDSMYANSSTAGIFANKFILQASRAKPFTFNQIRDTFGLKAIKGMDDFGFYPDFTGDGLKIPNFVIDQVYIRPDGTVVESNEMYPSDIDNTKLLITVRGLGYIGDKRYAKHNTKKRTKALGY